MASIRGLKCRQYIFSRALLRSDQHEAPCEDFTRGLSVLHFKLYTSITIYFLSQYNELSGTQQNPFYSKTPIG